eukprot:scaffold6461_cov96-Isochrysis_galbana.AAC.2
MRCPGRHRAVPTTGSGGPCAGPQDSSAASQPHSQAFTQSTPSRQSVSRAWFSPSFKRCLRPCTPPVRLFSVYSVHVQPSIRHLAAASPQYPVPNPLPAEYQAAVARAIPKKGKAKAKGVGGDTGTARARGAVTNQLPEHRRELDDTH